MATNNESQSDPNEETPLSPKAGADDRTDSGDELEYKDEHVTGDADMIGDVHVAPPSPPLSPPLSPVDVIVDRNDDDDEEEKMPSLVTNLFAKKGPSSKGWSKAHKAIKSNELALIQSTRNFSVLTRIEAGLGNEEYSSTLHKLFERYDFDQSGTINEPKELEDLTVNVVSAFKMVLDVDKVKDECDAATQACIAPATEDDNMEETTGQLNWTLPEFTYWFQNRIVPLDSFKEEEYTGPGEPLSYAFLEAQAGAGRCLQMAQWSNLESLDASLDIVGKRLRGIQWEGESATADASEPEPEPVSVILAHKHMMHEHSGPKGMVADIPPLRERRMKYSECMQEVSAMHAASDNDGLSGCLVLLVRKLKALGNARWNEFPLLLGALRHIEGNFGSGVGSYFRFLRWIILLNLVLAFIWAGFVIIPWILDPPDAGLLPGASAGGIMTGDGMENSWFFYGGYPAVLKLKLLASNYDMAFAYTVATLGMFAMSLISIVDRIFVERAQAGNDLMPAKYSTTLYSQMDLTVTAASTQKVLSKGYANQIRIHIADEFAIHALKEKMATWKDKFFFVGRRLLGLFITVATFALALFLIGLVVQHGDQITDAFPYGIPLLLAIVKQGMPPLLNIAVALEGHDSIEQVLLQSVIRVYIYKMFNLFIMFYQIYQNVEAGKIGVHGDCIETEVGKIFYNAMLMDMFVVAGSVAGTSFAVLKMNKFNEMKEPRTEFDHELVGGNVIDLMYRQAMIWCGSVLSPVLCLWGAVMNYIIFKVQEMCFLRTHRPPEKAWGASDSNKVFLMLLGFTLLIAALPAGAFMNRTMTCGSFDGKENPMEALNDFVANIPDLQNAIGQATNPFVLVAVIVVLVLYVKLQGTEIQKLDRRLRITDEEWTREKEEKETLMRRCLEAGMSKEDLDRGNKKKDVDKEMDSDEEET